MKLKKQSNSFFNNWNAPLIFYSITFFNIILSIFYNSDFITIFSIVLFLIGFLVITASIIYNFFKKERRIFLKSFLISFSISIVGVFYFIIFSLFYIVDHNIPKMSQSSSYDNILSLVKNTSIPISLLNSKESNDSIRQIKKDYYPQFQLYKKSNSEIFEYDFWYSNISAGFIYLKGFDLLNNKPLSERTLSEKSKLRVFNSSFLIKRFGSNKSFEIFDSNSKDFYLFKIELWYKADTCENETLLFTQNYKYHRQN